MTDDQAETDRYWNAIIENGGSESQCSWCKEGFFLADRAASLDGRDEGPGSRRRKRVMDAMMTMRRIDVAKIEAARAGSATA